MDGTVVNLKKVKGRNIELPIISILFSMHFLQLHNTYISVNSRAHPPQPLSSKCNKKAFKIFQHLFPWRLSRKNLAPF